LLEGQYAFIETTFTGSGRKAVLQSPEQPGPTGCLQFWYHMYGTTIGSLRVFTLTGLRESTYWVKKGTQGDKWRFAQVDFKVADKYKVLLHLLSSSTETLKLKNWKSF